MTFFDVYVGDLNDPSFHWDGGDWNGNHPKGLASFPWIKSQEPYNQALNAIYSDQMIGKKTDWGCDVGIASKAVILQLIDEWYGDGSELLEFKQGELKKLRDIVQNLEPKNYALVALET